MANIITSVRIILAPTLFFFHGITNGFLIIYLICAVSDLLDGPIARKTNTAVLLGFVLDTTGDVLMYAGMMKVLIFSGAVPGWAIVWIADALIIHVASALIAGHRFGKLYFTHSIMSKLMGVAMFLIPFTFRFGIITEYMVAVCIISGISAVEALLIQLKTASADADIRSVFALTRKSEIFGTQIGDQTTGEKERE